MNKNITYEKNLNPYFWSEIDGTDKMEYYNCGSFALDSLSWITPYGDKSENNPYSWEDRALRIQELYDEGYSMEEIEDEILYTDTRYLLETVPWIEEVEWEEIEPDDRVIAYRIYIDETALENDSVIDDFHFKVRIGNQWFQKLGGDKIEVCDGPHDYYDKIWQITPFIWYDSFLKFFRFKKA